MDCDGTYECSAEEHAAGCISAELDPPTEHGLRPAWPCAEDRDRECGHPRCLDCPVIEPW